MKSFVLLICSVFLWISCTPETDKLVRFDTDQLVSPSSEFIGLGVEWSAYPHADADDAEWGLLMTPEKWDIVFKRLDYMKPNIVRVMDQANWRYLKGVDKNGELILDFESQQMQALYTLLDYCEKNNITVILGEWGEPYQVHDTQLNMESVFSGTDDPKWHDIIVEHLDYLINTKGYTVIKYYNLVNEPNGYWASVNGNWDEWKAGIQSLHQKFEEKGLTNKISLIGPDAVAPYNNEASKYTGYEWAKESILQLNDTFSAYDIHDYPLRDFVVSGDFSSHYSKLIEFADSVARKPFIFGEIGFEKWTKPNLARIEKDPFASNDSQLAVYDFSYGVDMADAAIQALSVGFDAAIAWGLDDAMHTNGDTGDKTQLKKWGMWNILGSELTGDSNEENIRPWFYTWALMSRYFPSEMNILKSSKTNKDGLRYVVGISDSKQLSIAVVNNSAQEQSIDIDLSAYALKAELKKYLYTEEKRPIDTNGFPIPIEDGIHFSSKDKMKVIIPAQSFLVLTSFDF